jgi:hypothetical protein
MKNAIAIGVSVVALAMASSSLAPAMAQSGGYDRADRDRSMRDNGPTVNQLVDQADSRIARLKADLRLTPEQADKWGDLQKVLHDRAVRSAESWIKLREEIADQRQRARDERRRERDERARDRDAATPAPDTSAQGTAPVGNNNAGAENRPATDSRPADTRADTTRADAARGDRDDDIAAMRRHADALTNMAADLRKIADASEPLYRLLDSSQRQVLIRFVSTANREQDDEGPRRYRRR